MTFIFSTKLYIFMKVFDFHQKCTTKKHVKLGAASFAIVVIHWFWLHFRTVWQLLLTVNDVFAAHNLLQVKEVLTFLKYQSYSFVIYATHFDIYSQPLCSMFEHILCFWWTDSGIRWIMILYTQSLMQWSSHLH